MDKYELVCPENEVRIDSWIPANIPGLSRSRTQKLIADGFITLNGKAAKPGTKLKAGDMILVQIPDPEPSDVEAEDIDLDIVYEDEDIMVINKPRGMVVHPAAGNRTGTLVNALLSRCGDTLSDINGVIRPGIVHRIDRDTSGLLVAAKNNFAHVKLSAMLKTHDIQRIYIALCEGVITSATGVIDAPVGRSQTDRKKMSVLTEGGRSAITHFKVLKNFKDVTYLEIKLETGRTHQIRVHMAYIGYPVVGDELYGKKKLHPGLKTRGQALHAKKLIFNHPRTGELMTFETTVPEYFLELFDYFT